MRFNDIISPITGFGQARHERLARRRRIVDRPRPRFQAPLTELRQTGADGFRPLYQRQAGTQSEVPRRHRRAVRAFLRRAQIRRWTMRLARLFFAGAALLASAALTLPLATRSALAAPAAG
ncbi:hypothetical protein, partial [Methylobacterium sp. WL103]|uniref:hypothetical protein n=1 Tax=Methylobacterium sp. WL103 TaxID=2603891 RepID=UPI001AEE05EE